MKLRDAIHHAAQICREFAASAIATNAERREHLEAAETLDQLKGDERRHRATDLEHMLDLDCLGDGLDDLGSRSPALASDSVRRAGELRFLPAPPPTPDPAPATARGQRQLAAGARPL